MTKGPESHRRPCSGTAQAAALCEYLRARFSAAQPSPYPALSLHLPGIQVQSYTSWADSVWWKLQVEESSQEASSGPVKLDAHQQLWAELEAKEELYQRTTQLGQQALLAARVPVKEVGPLSWLPPPTLT